MKILIILFVILTVIILIFFISCKNKSNNHIGNYKDFDKYFNSLIKSNNANSFLVIQVKDSDDFIQFKFYTTEGLEIDFPLITSEQKSKKNEIINFCKNNNLNYKITNDVNNTNEFLDIYLDVNKENITNIIILLFENIFKTTNETFFIFQYDGFKIE